MNPAHPAPIESQDFLPGAAAPRWLPSVRVSVALAFLVVVLLQVVIAFRVPAPEVWVHDEASYLLGADTLRLGRLANPSPPSPEHFDMVHALTVPTYATKYPLAQSMFLAVGKGLLGLAHRGVVLSVALAAAAAAWAGAGWAGRRGALATGLLFAVVYGSGHYWVRSYWGGAPAALGAFLVVGAFPRLRSSWDLVPSAALGTGLSLLFLSRPYEGGVLGLAFLAALVPSALRAWSRSRRALVSALALVLLIGSSSVVLQLAANRAVTGRWGRLPYVEHTRRFLIGPVFWFQSAQSGFPSPLPDLIAVNRWELEMFQEKKDAGPLKALFLFGNVAPVVSWIRFLPLLALVPVLRRRSAPGLPTLLAVTFLCWLSVAVETYRFEHYLAPFVACLLVLLGTAWAAASSSPRHGRWAGWLVAAFLVLETRNSVRPYFRMLARPDSFPVAPRVLAEGRLRGEPGNHVVFVRWRGEPSAHQVWIANGVPLESQRILWVRDLGPEANARIRTAFPGRRPWLCVPDPEGSQDPVVTPLPDGPR